MSTLKLQLLALNPSTGLSTAASELVQCQNNPISDIARTLYLAKRSIERANVLAGRPTVQLNPLALLQLTWPTQYPIEVCYLPKPAKVVATASATLSPPLFPHASKPSAQPSTKPSPASFHHTAICSATGLALTWLDGIGQDYFTAYAVHPYWASKESIGRLRYAIARPNRLAMPVDAQLVAADILYILGERSQAKGHGLTHTTPSLLAQLHSELCTSFADDYAGLLRTHKQALTGMYRNRHRALNELIADTQRLGPSELESIRKRGLTPAVFSLLAFIQGATTAGQATIAATANEVRLSKEERKEVQRVDIIDRKAESLPVEDTLDNMPAWLTTIRPKNLAPAIGKVWRTHLATVSSQEAFAAASTASLQAAHDFFQAKFEHSIKGSGMRFANALGQARYQKALYLLGAQLLARKLGDADKLVVARADEAAYDLNF
jgi:hypothetical protein